MKKLIEGLFTSRNGQIIIGILNLISMSLAIRGLFKTKSTLRALLHIANATVSGYMLFKTARELGLKKFIDK